MNQFVSRVKLLITALVCIAIRIACLALLAWAVLPHSAKRMQGLGVIIDPKGPTQSGTRRREVPMEAGLANVEDVASLLLKSSLHAQQQIRILRATVLWCCRLQLTNPAVQSTKAMTKAYDDTIKAE